MIARPSFTPPFPALGAPANRRAAVGSALAAVALLGLVAVLYGASRDYGVFWDDPVWFGRARGVTLAQLLGGDPGYQFYRPLTLAFYRLWWRDGVFWAWGLHAAQVCFHAGVVLLSVDLARRWTGRRLAAWLAGLLVAVFPFSQQAVAWAATQQPLVTLLMLAATCAYARFQPGRRRRWLVLSLIAYGTALFVQESAAPLALLFVFMELPRLRTDGGPDGASPGAGHTALRGLAWAGGHLALVGVYGLLYLRAERLPGIAGRHFEGEVAAYLLQAVAFPVARALGLAGGWWPTPGLILGLAAVWVLLVAALRRAGWVRPAVLASAWMGLTLLPTWAFLGWAYVAVGPRLVYAAVPGVAILWASAAAVGLGARSRRVRVATGLAAAVVVLAGVNDVMAQNRMLAVGAGHLRDAVSAQAGPERRLLFINFPDRYRLRQGPFPMGYWGVTLAPVVQELSDYAITLTGAGDDTESRSMPQANAEERRDWPYDVDMRGVAIQWPELVQMARATDGVVASRYEADGSLRLVPVGAFLPPQDGLVARIGPARLVRTALEPGEGEATLRLWWRPGAGERARLDDAVFVHLLSGDGRLAAQWDADTWAGLLPPKAWPVDRTVLDVRALDLAGVPSGRYALVVGLYNRKTGERYPAVDADGQRLPDDAVPVGTVELP